MALSEDQKAMLKLVSQPETSYEDIAALMGLSVDEVRTKVDAALKQLDQGDPAPEPPAEEKPAAPPVEEKAPPPPPEPKPKAAPKPKPKPKAPATARPRPARPKTPLKLPDDRGARWGLIAGGAVVLVMVLLLVTGVLGGGDDTTGSSSGATGTEGSTTDASGQPEPTGAVLKASDGGDAAGRAVFARSGKNVLLLLSASGLEASPKGQSYTVSLSKSPRERVPLIATRVGDAGKIGGQFQVAAQVLGLLASGYDEMEVSLVPDDELATALKTAQQDKKAPTYSGTTFMQGPVTGPIVEGQG